MEPRIEGADLEFSVAGGPSLLDAFMAMFLARRYRRAHVQRVYDPSVPEDAVTVSLRERWLLLTHAAGAQQQMVRALSDGATAVLSMDTTVEEFERAIEAVVTGRETYVPAELMRQMAASSLQRHGPVEEGAPNLSSRQMDVLQLLVQGYTNHEIAQELTISINTVRSHIATISTKLNADSRARLIAQAYSMGLMEQGDDDEGRPSVRPYGMAQTLMAARR